MSSLRASTMFLVAFFQSVRMEIAHGQMKKKAPSRWIDGKAIDQGIAYFLGVNPTCNVPMANKEGGEWYETIAVRSVRTVQEYDNVRPYKLDKLSFIDRSSSHYKTYSPRRRSLQDNP
ncbi:hypothetical protein M5K25_004683 [Dendrobium thyrsiflorum]|uniref:Secreted protein n=1 Tax=Dendrobium thyrsiflorum TaxID=117978 RepID=A0ABD0VFG8_DENTH